MACVQSGDSVGACMWMLDGWELYVYGNLLVKWEIVIIGTRYADETEDDC